MALLDDGGLASGMTQVTTAHLMGAIDDRFFNIEWWHGERGAQLAAESHAQAIDRIQSIADELRSTANSSDGWLFAVGCRTERGFARSRAGSGSPGRRRGRRKMPQAAARNR